MKKVFKNKFFWIVFILFTIISLVLFYGYSIYVDIKGDAKPEVQTDIVEKEFKSFILYFDSTDYQRELFSELETTYVEGEADEESVKSYVDVYSKNFVADFLTLNVKDTELNRIGGKQFLVEPLQASYEELDGVSDYYFSKNYYIKEHKDTYKDV